MTLKLRHHLRAAILPAIAVSMVAGAANAQANLNDMPSWSEFPVPPTNVPTAADIHQRVLDTNAKRQALRTEVRALVWDNSNPEAYASSALNRIDPKFAEAVEKPLSVTDIEKLANDLRRRAAAPPIAD